MRTLFPAIVATAWLGCALTARADEITLVGAGGVQAAVEKMIPAFEKQTGHKVKATFGSGLGTKRQVANGEPFDVRTGAPRPDISTPEAVKRVLLGAKSISYPDPSGGAAAGVSFTETLKTLGIAEQMKPKIKLAQGGAAAMAALARGDVEIGLTFISEILTEPGVESVGPLPREISTPTGLVGFVSTHAKSPAHTLLASSMV